ncbi:MAG: sigma-54-dependent Fis family transcriptional regulator [Acidobacteria bacterium]|nr:sigma-54-dependent Fis family transcriptional regulator [Acidobacteriota bacterium]
MRKPKVLIVDDDPAIRFGMGEYLEFEGFDVSEAADCEGALQSFTAVRPDMAILDYSLPDGNALGLLPRLQQVDCTVPLLILTGHGSIDLAVQAIKLGAEQFLTKPVELPALLAVLRRLIENQRNRRTQAARESLSAREEISPFVGGSAAIRRLADEARRIAAVESPVLIQGETGSGKGVLAHWLHRNGPRAAEAFVDLNCAGLSREFLETELFGHERGAFTGAVNRKTGLLEVADRGTVFLDEVGDIEQSVQPKLLKVLEEKQFRRMGEVRDRVVDIRLIAASHRDLQARVREGFFRADLYFRISTVPLRIPPLRDRVEDILPLATTLLERLASDLGRPRLSIAPDAARALEEYRWPGNIRELRNVLERAVLLSDREEFHRADLRFEPLSQVVEAVANLTLEEVERQHIERILALEGGRVPAAAAKLGIPRSTLYEKLKRYGLRSVQD